MEFAVNVIGWVGMVLLLGAYALLTARRLAPGSWQYQSMNLVGGLALMINTAWFAAWPSAALNLVWFVIGLYALSRMALGRRQSVRSDSPRPVS